MNHSPQVTVKKTCHTLSCKRSHQLALSSLPLSAPTTLPLTSPLSCSAPLNCRPRCHVFACAVSSAWGTWSLSLLISLLFTLQNPVHLFLPLCETVLDCPPPLSTTPSCWTDWYSFLDPHIGLQSQSCGFSSSHVQMWELDHKEGWAPKNWCFRTMVLEKSLESPLNCKEDQTSQS